MIDLSAHPECLWRPDHHSDIHWWHGHIPFAFFVIGAARPRRLVELGTHKGDSYLAFCQAVAGLGLDTECVAVDGWVGDEHVGDLDPSIYENLKKVHDPRYGAFSRLYRTTFEEAVDDFDDGTIDVLHIDGAHTFEAVSRDVELWLPKLSNRGILLMHDIAVKKWGYRVWEVWQDVRLRYPVIEFNHSAGLGVAAVGSAVPEEFASIVRTGIEERQGVVALFAALGNQLIYELDGAQVLDQHARLHHEPGNETS